VGGKVVSIELKCYVCSRKGEGSLKKKKEILEEASAANTLAQLKNPYQLTTSVGVQEKEERERFQACSTGFEGPSR